MEPDLPNKHRQAWLTLVILGLLILLAAGWWWQKGSRDSGSPGGLTDEERQKILDYLNQPNEAANLTPEERARIEQDLNNPDRNPEPLTPEERERILESLNR